MTVPTTGVSSIRADGIEAAPSYSFGLPASFANPDATLGGAVFNILDYGAHADPSFNNQPAIQAAIDAAHAAGGGVVYIPPGTFGIAAHADGYGSIHVLSNVYLQGTGMGESVLRLVDGHDGVVTGLVRSPWGEETSNWGLADLTIDGNKENTSGQVDGFFTGPEPGSTLADRDVTAMRVEITGVSRYGFDPHELTVRLTIKDSVAHDNAVDGFVLDRIVEADVSGNESYSNGRHGFNVVTTSEDILFEDNVAHDNGGAGFVVQRGSEIIESPSVITISGGASYGNGREGVLVQFSDHVIVEDMEIYENGRQGVRLFGSSNSTVQFNQIHDNSQAKPEGFSEVEIESYLPSSPSPSNPAYVAEDNTVAGNSILSVPGGQARYGIEVIGQLPTDNTIGENLIGGTVRGAYLLEGLSGQVAYAEANGGNLTGTSQADALMGSAADDIISGKDGDDVALAGAGDDKVSGGKGRDVLSGGDGSDVLFGNSGNDSLIGEAGNDKLSGSSGDDLLAGGDGADIHHGGSGNDMIYAGAGNDRAFGNSGDDTLYGDGGNDRLFGQSGNDLLNGGLGDDFISGGSGNDTIFASLGADRYDGDGGSDTLDFSRILAGVDINASTKTAKGPVSLRFDSIETFVGSGYSDTFRGSDRAETFAGGAGDDVIRSAGGRDFLTGGAGADVYQFHSRDLLDGDGRHRGVDLITDFQVGDVIDLSALARPGDAPPAAQFVKTAAGLRVVADIDGRDVAIVDLKGVYDADIVSFATADALLAS